MIIYNDKDEIACCGGILSASREGFVLDLGHRDLANDLKALKTRGVLRRTNST